MELLVVLLVGGVITVFVRARRSANATTFKPAGAFRPATGLEARPAPTRPIRALARREAVLLLRHPAFVVGLVVLMPLMLLIGAHLDVGTGILSQEDAGNTLMLVPLGWAAILAANFGMLRSRRYGTEELFGGDTMPVGSRTAAHLLACFATLPVSLLLGAAIVAILRLEGWEGWPRIEVFLVGPLLVLGGAMLGVAVARWLPWAVFGWVAVIATFILQVAAGEADPRLRWLHFSSHGNDTSFDLPELQVERHGWHLVYLIGGILLVAAIALLRSPATPQRLALLGTAVVLVLVGGVTQLRSPDPAQAATLASRLQDPSVGQDCAEVDRVTYCSWPRYESWREGWRAPVEGVLARVPSSVTARDGGLVVSQRPDLSVRGLVDPDVRSMVDPRRVFPRERVVHAGFSWPEPIWSFDAAAPVRDFDLAYATALVALGLPDRPWWDETNPDPTWATRKLHDDLPSGGFELAADALQTCEVAGEARGVLALWLAAQATPEARRGLLKEAVDHNGNRYDDLFFEENYDSTVPPVLPRFGTLSMGDDVRAAVALLALPDDRVAEVVRRHWEELIDPETPASRLFELLGEVVPPPATTLPLRLGGIIPPIGRSADLPAVPAEPGGSAPVVEPMVPVATEQGER